MEKKKRPNTTIKQAHDALLKIGYQWNKMKFSPKDFATGIDVEYEHGLVNPKTNVTDDDPVKTAKIALAHLFETPDYYTFLPLVDEPEYIYYRNAMRETMKSMNTQK